MNKKFIAGALALTMVFGSAVSPIQPFKDSAVITASAADNKISGNFYYQVVHGGKSIQITGLHSKNVSEVVIPEKIEGLPVTEIGNNAFKDNKEIKKVILPEGITSIFCGAFAFCSNLTTINLPNSLKEIGGGNYLYLGAFYGTNISEIDFPSTLESIGGFAFCDCNNLTTVYIPEDTVVGSHAFLRTGDGNFFIYCYEASSAETYAINNNIEYESKPATLKLGDANYDRKVDVTDIAVIAAHIQGIQAIRGDGYKLSDVNKDKKLTVTDIAMIASHIKGIKALK